VKIYTKTGDDGSTGLYGGSRVPKDSLRIRVIGEIDEVNACLGTALCFIDEPALREMIPEIQRRLFDLGGELANPGRKPVDGIGLEDIEALETSIDAITAELAPLRAFVLPGGAKGAAFLHHARTVCRRSERALLELHRHEPVRSEVRIYVNRLSDWLFTAARGCNSLEGTAEIEWRPRLQKTS
jgi:cob(I)alamin adenosyltransferase